MNDSDLSNIAWVELTKWERLHRRYCEMYFNIKPGGIIPWPTPESSIFYKGDVMSDPTTIPSGGPAPMGPGGGSGGSSGGAMSAVTTEPTVNIRLNELEGSVQELCATLNDLESKLSNALGAATPSNEKTEAATPDGCVIAARIRGQRDMVEICRNRLVDFIERLEI